DARRSGQSGEDPAGPAGPPCQPTRHREGARVETVGLPDFSLDLARMARLVQSQLVSATTAFFQRDVTSACKVIDKDDQVDNLLGFLEEQCFRALPDEVTERGLESRRRRGVLRVAVNLEKLGDFAVNIAEQTVYVSRFDRADPPFDLTSPTQVA